METTAFEAGGYRYIRGPFQYSGGVAAQPGFAIERARFVRPVGLEEGFRRIEAHLSTLGRSPTAFCACELRSPAPFDDQGFIDFNRIYVGTLDRWGLFRDDENPVARTNVCPAHHAPGAPSFEAFSYTVPAEDAGRSFVLSGGGDARAGPGPMRRASSGTARPRWRRCARRGASCSTSCKPPRGARLRVGGLQLLFRRTRRGSAGRHGRGDRPRAARPVPASAGSSLVLPWQARLRDGVRGIPVERVPAAGGANP